MFDRWFPWETSFQEIFGCSSNIEQSSVINHLLLLRAMKLCSKFLRHRCKIQKSFGTKGKVSEIWKLRAYKMVNSILHPNHVLPCPISVIMILNWMKQWPFSNDFKVSRRNLNPHLDRVFFLLALAGEQEQTH